MVIWKVENVAKNKITQSLNNLFLFASKFLRQGFIQLDNKHFFKIWKTEGQP